MPTSRPPKAPAGVHYRVEPSDVLAHLFRITLTIARPAREQIVALPVWIPGSYLVREFSKNLQELRATQGRAAVRLTQLDKHRWQADCTAGAPLVLTYAVCAYDTSVRTAWLDASRGFFNGTSLCLRVHGQEALRHTLEIARTPATAEWSAATGLPALQVDRKGFGLYAAANYDELVDCPVEMGTFWVGRFTACGVPHRFVVAGAAPSFDGKRLLDDARKVCETAIRFWHGEGKPPFKNYLFLLNAVGDGYGGLEHRNSTALICGRRDLPRVGEARASEGYTTLLGLISHEYFHTWNVKRIKPAAFVPYDLTQEAYTRLLWAFEGFTSYYDDLCLVRSGAIDSATYLNLLAKTASAVKKGPGRHLQSVAESSFTAWTKYYRQDENAPNAVVSYYAKGSLIALALDLKLRAESGGKANLDQVMQLLWQRHGRTVVGVAEEGPNSVFAAVAEVGGAAAARWLKQAVTGTGDLPLERLLKPFGVTLAWEAASSLPVLGAKTGGEGSEVKLTSVYNGGPAEAAGLSAGDVLIAWDGLKLTPAALEKRLKRHRAGDQVKLHAFRRDELIEASLTLAAPAADVPADLRAARDAGLMTAYVERPLEYGPNQRPHRMDEGEFDITATDFLDLADQVGA